MPQGVTGLEPLTCGTTMAMLSTVPLGITAIAACNAVRSAQVPAGKLAFS